MVKTRRVIRWIAAAGRVRRRRERIFVSYRSRVWRHSLMAASGVHSGHDAPGAAADGEGGGWLRNAADYAWEFLRRNPDYRTEYANAERGTGAISPRWGLGVPADPTRSARVADVFWRPDVAPAIVLPLEAGRAEPAPIARELRTFGSPKPGQGGAYLRLADGLQVLLRGDARPEGPLVVVLALDADLGLRVRGAQALHQIANGGSAPPSRLKSAQRLRLDRSLRALDGSLRRENYRDIARGLFGPAAVEDEPWKTASLRDVTIRLVRSGRELMRGGYLRLLKGGL